MACGGISEGIIIKQFFMVELPSRFLNFLAPGSQYPYTEGNLNRISALNDYIKWPVRESKVGKATDPWI
jgi:hypothetical protein